MPPTDDDINRARDDDFDYDSPLEYTPPGSKDRMGGKGPRLDGKMPAADDREGGKYPMGDSPYTNTEDGEQWDEHRQQRRKEGRAIMDP